MSLNAYRVEFFETASQISNELWDTCFRHPAEGRWWYETLDHSGIEDQFSFFYGLIEHLGRPVGIAPGFVMDVPVEQVAPKEILRLLRPIGKILPSLLYQRTVFVGSPILDEGTVGLAPDVDRRTALLALQVALEKKADQLRAPLIVWKDFPQSSSADLNWLSHKRRLFRITSLPNTIVEFPSRRKEDYFASLKGSRRRNLKKRLRLSKERVALSVEIIQRPDGKTLDDIFALYRQTFEKSATKFESLGRKFFELIAEKRSTNLYCPEGKGHGRNHRIHGLPGYGRKAVEYVHRHRLQPPEGMDDTVPLMGSRGRSSLVAGFFCHCERPVLL